MTPIIKLNLLVFVSEFKKKRKLRRKQKTKHLSQNSEKLMFDLAFKEYIDTIERVIDTACFENTHSPDRGASLLYIAARWGHRRLSKCLPRNFPPYWTLRIKRTVRLRCMVRHLAPRCDCAVSYFPRLHRRTEEHVRRDRLDNAKAPAQGVSKAASKWWLRSAYPRSNNLISPPTSAQYQHH